MDHLRDIAPLTTAPRATGRLAFFRNGIVDFFTALPKTPADIARRRHF